MANYFRITAYHPEHDFSVIMDCNGMFDKLWQFSSLMVQKGFKIIEVGNEEKFSAGEMAKVEQDASHIFLRAHAMEKPIQDGKMITVQGKSYSLI